MQASDSMKADSPMEDLPKSIHISTQPSMPMLAKMAKEFSKKNGPQSKLLMFGTYYLALGDVYAQ